MHSEAQIAIIIFFSHFTMNVIIYFIYCFWIFLTEPVLLNLFIYDKLSDLTVDNTYIYMHMCMYIYIHIY